ncbi:MAG: ABC transporter ATP-binding protein [Planctomycetes bacterium]|nr:ABC transporter ATP-binding protein [Planctomycetota bacterium]
MSDETIIEARELGRWYGEVVGLSDLQVSFRPGITGLLGPNGAGKSTLMRLIVGELKPSRGSVSVLGLTPFANQKLYPRLGFAPQQDALFEDVSGADFVAFLLRMGGFSRKESRKLAVHAMQRVGLEKDMDRKCREYSKGMRQRTRLAQAIAHDPDLLILDEPLTGLDPVGRRQIMALFRELAEAGKSLVVSSHVLHEVQSLTDTIVLIHRGRLLAQGDVGEIRGLLSNHPREVRMRAERPRGLGAHVLAWPHVQKVQVQGDRDLSVFTSDLEAFQARLPEAIGETEPGLISLQSSDADLESVFDYLTQ